MSEHADIFSAIMGDELDVVTAMLVADPSLAARHDGQSPVLLAAYRRRMDILGALLERQPALDAFEATAAGLQSTVEFHVEMSPALLETYADDGFTLLHLAAFFGHEGVARVLLNAGAPVDAITRNDLENTPLHAAAAGRHFEVCELLIAYDAPVNALQHGGFTPLHQAAQHGDMKLAIMLVANDADPAIETDEGKSAADLAYEFEHDDLAAYLRSVGG